MIEQQHNNAVTQKKQRFIATDRERIWELFFADKWSIGRIARAYGVGHGAIISMIDRESGRKWRQEHPHIPNKVRLFDKPLRMRKR